MDELESVVELGGVDELKIVDRLEVACDLDAV